MDSVRRTLDRPPVKEVVCGFVLTPVPIGPLEFGIYWNSRRKDFPRHEEHPAVLTAPGVHIGPSPIRAWLIDQQNEFLVQMQPDRFYANWRHQDGATYPGFRQRENREGLLSFALAEFNSYADFCQAECGVRPEVQQLELSKVDQLRRGVHFADFEDLRKLLRVARVFDDVSSASSVQMQLRLVESHGTGNTIIAITTQHEVVQIEVRHTFAPSGDLRSSFEAANDRVNSVFFGLLDEDELRRFGLNQERT